MTNKINMTDSSTPLMSHSCDDVQRINIIDRTPVFKGFWEYLSNKTKIKEL